MNAKTLAAWVVLAFVVWLVIQNPHSAASVIQHIGDFISTALSGLSHLVSTI